MAQNNPYDMNPWMKAFDPEQMKKMWSPQAMMAMFQPQQPQATMFDFDQVVQANQRNFEAMAEANRMAAETYKDLLDKQMEIFDRMTRSARQQYDWAEDNAGPDQMRARTKAMNEAVEEALGLMRKLADATREANQEAYGKMKGEVEKAVEDLKKAQSKK